MINLGLVFKTSATECWLSISVHAILAFLSVLEWVVIWITNEEDELEILYKTGNERSL